MKIFITEQQKAELERLHDSSRDGRVRDRIKAILLASEGWSSAMIAQALRLHQTTIDHHISEFLNKGKLKPENGGSDSKLSAEQTAFLISQLSDNLFHHTRDVIAFVTRTWNIIFSIPGMNKWLHRNGVTYKKPSGVPHKFSEEKQRQFIEYYKELKTTVGDEPILFIDGVHPTQATKISYGWIRKGQKKAVKTTGSRTRLNIMGALNLKALTSPLICEYKTINEYNVSRFSMRYERFILIITKNPRYSGWSRLPPFTVSERLGGSGKYQAALPSPLQSKPESDRKNVEINERTCPE